MHALSPREVCRCFGRYRGTDGISPPRFGAVNSRAPAFRWHTQDEPLERSLLTKGESLAASRAMELPALLSLLRTRRDPSRVQQSSPA